MWNYVWSRNRLLQRVVLNKRWQPQAFRLSRGSFSSLRASPRHGLTTQSYACRSLLFKTRPTKASSSSSAMSRVHSVARSQKRNFNLSTFSTRFQQQTEQTRARSKALAFMHTSLCIGLSAFLVKQSLEDIKLKVPSRREVDEENGFASIKNAAFVHGTYDEIIDEFIPKFNDTDREIIKNLELVLAGCDSYETGFWRGKLVCEIGSGTGILAFPIINKIGTEKTAGGGYIGLDISSAFVHYLDREFERRGLLKSRAISGRNTPQSLCLPDNLEGKIDIFVICDTYYHLDDASATLKEMRKYLKRGGKLVIIEDRREEDTVTKEMNDAGFNLGYELKSDKFDTQFVCIFNKV